MKSLLCWIVVAVTVTAGAVYAQDISGAWQGTLQAGKDLRIVFTIATADGGGLKATMYSIDQGGQGIAATAVTLQGTTFRMSIAALNGTYEGKLTPDGNSIAGTWSQGGGALPLTLVRANRETAWAIPAPPAAMATNVPAAFEVATIKPSEPGRPGKLFTVRGRQVITINTSVSDLLMFAYGVHARQITAGPAWIGSDKYDITGQPEGQGQPNERQLREMIQKLLTDRFKLTFHRDKRELQVYAIVAGNGGPKLTKNDTNPDGLPSLLFRGLGVLPALNATIGDLASVMQSAVLDRPVIDRSGLSGRFDFTLTWTPDESQFSGLGVRFPAPSADANAPPGLFTAIQEQLGLKLDSTNAPVEVLVIDRIDKPSEN